MNGKDGSKIKSDFADYIGNVLYALLRMIVWILVIAVIIIGIYETPNISTWNNLTDNYVCVMNNFYSNKDCSIYDVEMLNEFVETLPPVFIREFRENWKVIIEDYASNTTIGGYTDWDSRIILVKKQTNFTDTLDTFVHELGHCFDFEYGSVSYSDIFGNIYDLYKDDFSEQYTNSPVGYSTSSAIEFFATCFKEYLLYPEHLKTVAPKAYNFVNNFYEDIQKIKYMYVYDLGAVANTALRLANISN